MANGLTIKLEGFDTLLAVLKKAPAELSEEVAIKLKDGALAIQEDAKLRAPVNYGILRNSIVVDPPIDKGLTISVSSLADYSAYVEFGTGTKVDVPEGVEEYALTFKGQKIIPGMHARPFLFPAVRLQTPKIIEDLRRSLQKALEKT